MVTSLHKHNGQFKWSSQEQKEEFSGSRTSDSMVSEYRSEVNDIQKAPV